MREISERMREIERLPLLLLAISISVSLAVVPAAGYELVVPGDLDGDFVVSDQELEEAESSLDHGEISEEELEEIEHIHDNYLRDLRGGLP